MHPGFQNYKFLVTAVMVALAINGLFFSRSVAGQTSLAPTSTTALPPANDDFANAQLLIGATGTVTGTTAAATKEAAEFPHARNRGGASVWYKYVATGNSIVTFSTNNSVFDTTMAVYKGSTLSSLKLIAENDDAAPTTLSQVSVGTKVNDVLYIAVDGYYNSGSGVVASGAIQLGYSVANVAANDNFANAQTLSGQNGFLVTASNVGASKESGEPNIYNNSGGKSIWFKWFAPASPPKSMTFTVESSGFTANPGVNTLLGVYTGTSVNNLTYVSSCNLQNISRIPFVTTPNTTYYFVIDGWDQGVGADTGTFIISYRPSQDYKSSDFDRDGKTDLAVFRPSTGSWYSMDSITDRLRSVQFGANGDKPMLVDLGTDGKLDYTIYRPDTGIWYVLDTEQGFRAIAWGVSGDIPLAFNWSGFYNQFSVFRPTTGMWWEYHYYSGFGQGRPWGTNGDIPIHADFGGYGIDQEVVFRPSDGTWYATFGNVFIPPTKFGQSGDKPVPADYDGDGLADRAVFRPSAGVWYIQFSSNGAVSGIQWGVSTDVPQPADYDGDGKADIAVFRSGTWYIRLSSNLSLRVVQFGLPGDIPLAAPIH